MRRSMRHSALLLVAVLISGGFVVHGQTKPSTAPATAPSLKQLQAERLRCAQQMLDVAEARMRVGNGTASDVVRARRLVLESQMDMVDTPAQRLAIAQAQVAACEAYFNQVQQWVDLGRTSADQLPYAGYDLAEARVLEAKLQASP